MTAPKQTSCEMDIEKKDDLIVEESEAITQLLQMKHLQEEQLRKQISLVNPEWREEVSRFNYTELQGMLDQTIAELRKAVARK